MPRRLGRGLNRDAAIAAVGRFDTCTVWVDEIHIQGVLIPFGGHKQSGMRGENGVEGLSEFIETRTMMTRK